MPFKSVNALAQAALRTQAGSGCVGFCEENQLVILSPEKNYSRPRLQPRFWMTKFVSANLSSVGALRHSKVFINHMSQSLR